MNRIIRDLWGVWCFLGLSLSTLVFTIIIAWQCGQIIASMRIVEERSVRSIDDRDRIHRNQEALKREQDLLKHKLEAIK